MRSPCYDNSEDRSWHTSINQRTLQDQESSKTRLGQYADLEQNYPTEI